MTEITRGACWLAGVNNGVPKYAIACVVDYGGSGGKVAGPVANQLVRALMEEGVSAEGQRGDEQSGGPLRSEHTGTNAKATSSASLWVSNT